MNIFLAFSDAAKYADIARNLVNGLGYGNKFSFFGDGVFGGISKQLFYNFDVLPVTPYSIAGFFRLFGTNDFAVMATSFFYYILTLIFTYLFAKKLFNLKLAGFLSALAVGFNKDIITYATGGASESPFMFEIVAACYFVSLKKGWSNIVALILLVLMYFTRPQAFIYIAGIILFYLIINLKIKKALIAFAGVVVLSFLIDCFVLKPISGQSFLYSVIGRGMGASFNQSSTASDVLRGATNVASSGLSQIAKNIFYNLYNFFKLMPQIMSPYLFGLFTIGLFLKSKTKKESSFKWVGFFMVILTFLITASSIPFFRYLHPVVPIVYIIAIGTIVNILESRFENCGLKNFRNTCLIAASIFLVLVFGVGQTVGNLILDSRYERNTHNTGKPPVYVELSKILSENTKTNDVVITNLDTWGSWYGERRTVWFPIEPKQLIDPSTGKIPFDAIYLTSYQIDDANYYMGESWRLIFNNPDDSKKWTCDGCIEIAKEFTLKNVYFVDQNDNYERMGTKAILLIKK